MKDHIIKIPHLKTIIVVRKKKKGDDGVEEELAQKLGWQNGAAAYVKRVCSEEYLLVVPLPIKGKVSAAHLVHEIVHLLQYIVEDNNMSFTFEREHMAYIAGYIFDEVCKL